MRGEIRRASGREVCFLAEVDAARRIVRPRAVARGNRDAVLAAAKDARAGDILLHNHPSGNLEPSGADLALAARVYEAGVGTGIVDNRAHSLYVVVEPPAPEEAVQELDPAAVSRHLLPGGGLEVSYPGYEHRPSQLDMLLEVTERYNQGGVGLLEAGTGTGKSLAYLLPAVEWALANGERTVVSTHTINLQEQLAGKDLPLVRKLVGDGFRWALVKGRGNYVSLRRLYLAGESAETLFESDRTEEMKALVEWGRETVDGSLSDLTRRPPEEIWEEVRSDGDVCLGARCPHFGRCFYQRSRRESNGADVLVVNHALLFADLALRRATDNWTESAVLPAYGRLVLDEAHNVEEAATRHLGAAVTRVGMVRLLDRLERSGPKGRSGRRGLLRAVEKAAALRGTGRDRARLAADMEEGLRPAVADARDALDAFFTALDPFVPSRGEEPLRLGCGDPRDPLGHAGVQEGLDALLAAFSRLGRRVEILRGLIEEDADLSDVLEGRVLDLRSVERRVAAAARGLALVLATDEDGAEEWVRWIEERARRRRPNAVRNVALAAAPVEPGLQLREALFDRVETAVVTSATLATGTGFRFIRERLGLSSPEPSSVPDEAVGSTTFADTASPGADGEGLTVTESLLASPFDYREQAIFCVPTDLPPLGPGPDFQFATARVVSEFAAITGGGLFVLFTSYQALGSVARRIRATDPRLGGRLLVHREAPRSRLLRRFVDAGDRILLGTASFWEGVDVRGDALRGLILQKLPFRVPTEPITQARMEAVAAKGLRPFDAYQVPLAALRLKQGFGRLVRSREDRGAVILLDSRIVTRSYGRALRAALPPAPMVRGSWAEVRRRIADFYGDGTGVAGSGIV
ncbi:MAG: helicase [Gammaproteobacteria bacterium]|nr:helicase [Gammaproteobacteria bacterium]